MKNEHDTTSTEVAPSAAPPEVTPTQTGENNIFVTQPVKKKKTGLIVAISVAVAAVLLIVAAILVYNLWYQNPNKVVHDAVVNTMRAKSMVGKGDVLIKSEQADVSMVFDTKSDATLSSMAVRATIKSNVEDEPFELTIGGEARYVDGVFYVKLNDVEKAVDALVQYSGQSAPAEVMALVRKIDDQWVSISPDDYKADSPEVAKQQTCMDDISKQMASDKKMTDELVALYRKNQVVVVDESLGSKTIDGTDSLGYKVSFSTDNMKKLVESLGDTEFGKKMKQCDDSVDFGEIADMFKESTSSSKATQEIWVSRFGHQLTQVKVTEEDKASKSAFSFQPKFNETIEVAKPDDAISIKDLMKDIEELTGSYMSAYGASREAYDPAMYEQYQLEG